MTAILYAAKTKLTPTHYRVIAWKGQVTHETIWVRAVLYKGDLVDLEEDWAKPRKGEKVLNAVEV